MKSARPLFDGGCFLTFLPPYGDGYGAKKDGKIPSLPVFSIRLRPLSEEAEQNTCRHGRTYYAGHVRTHGMHQQVVAAVVFESDILRYAR